MFNKNNLLDGCCGGEKERVGHFRALFTSLSNRDTIVRCVPFGQRMPEVLRTMISPLMIKAVACSSIIRVKLLVKFARKPELSSNRTVIFGGVLYHKYTDTFLDFSTQ